MESLQTIKQRYKIIGNDPKLNRAVEKAIQVAPTDISVLIMGESGVGKENFPKIIHSLSYRKHGKYIAVNCGAIPEGTIDSELFGHEKGAFTGAISARDGYFEVADGGTLFLDEIGELPLTTQVRLLRILENGEFIKVGSSKVQKTDVRIIAATNINMQKAIQEGKFREDLYYRLSTVEINIPPLRERGEDIYLLFRKFVADFAQKYNMPPLKLEDNAIPELMRYRWDGNIRQLKNVAEQMSVLETNRNVSISTLKEYLPDSEKQLPSLVNKTSGSSDFSTEREILYKVLFDMKNDILDLKNLTHQLLNSDNVNKSNVNKSLVNKIYGNTNLEYPTTTKIDSTVVPIKPNFGSEQYDDLLEEEYLEPETVEQEPNLKLEKQELELIKKALEKYKGKRKLAAQELGVSERTLYRKIKQYDL